MSHEATNWAIKQRGLKPAAKLVLWHLCDRYHPDNGCFPSKETLAEDCEMSVRSVYDQITILEEAGLLKVVEQVFQKASGKFTSNSYILGCDPKFAQYVDPPSANSAVGKNAYPPSANSRSYRRQNLPTNSVKEPVKEKTPAGAISSLEEKIEFWAEKINGPGFVSASSIKAGLARAIIASGKVTPEKMKERGISA